MSLGQVNIVCLISLPLLLIASYKIRNKRITTIEEGHIDKRLRKWNNYSARASCLHPPLSPVNRCSPLSV